MIFVFDRFDVSIANRILIIENYFYLHKIVA